MKIFKRDCQYYLTCHSKIIDILEEIRSKEWLVNEANISMYIDKDMLSANGGIIEPSRLYLYDLVNKAPVIDYFVETLGILRLR